MMLKTEMRNPNTMHIDQMSTAEMLQCIQNENRRAVNALDDQLPALTQAVDAIAARMQQGGRLFYIGCGTSGRLGVLDAAECPPTYGVPHGLVIGIIAGGDRALRFAAENAEDNFESGYGDLNAYDLTEQDSVVGISAAGGAKYVLGALHLAEKKGALRIAVTSNADTPLEHAAQIAICPDTGAEVITGSTRMKAGTAHKMILNMLSTAVMIRLGHVYENLMINLKPTNEKLEQRMVHMVCDICGVESDVALQLLKTHDFSIREAVASYQNR